MLVCVSDKLFEIKNEFAASLESSSLQQTNVSTVEDI